MVSIKTGSDVICGTVGVGVIVGVKLKAGAVLVNDRVEVSVGEGEGVWVTGKITGVFIAVTFSTGAIAGVVLPEQPAMDVMAINPKRIELSKRRIF
jgi:hypothetical protein